MKVVHLTVARRLTSGQARQLRFEYDAARGINDAQWITIAYQDSPATEPFMRRIPVFFRGMFLRNLWLWIVALKLSRRYDFVLMRHITFDPFVFIFAPFIHNRVSIHHAKEVEELRLVAPGWKGVAASCLENWTGGFAVRRARMVVGVTAEIAEYEREKRAAERKIAVYPNGIDVESVPLLADKRVPGEVHAAFICGKFSSWHGLDKLIAAVDAAADGSAKISLTIHLIGSLSDKQLREIAETSARRAVFRAYGLLNEDDYRPILEKCDFGVTSLALERKNLREASTLKVREMLACGLPVYSGHEDVALKAVGRFALVSNRTTVEELISFGEFVKSVSRQAVRHLSAPHVEKRNGIQALLGVLRTISCGGNCIAIRSES